MTESLPPPELDEEIKRKKLELAHAEIGDKSRIGAEILKLTLKKVGVGRKLDNFRIRMREAGDVAERSGVGTGGKGSKED